jgi:Exonuclease
MREIVIDTETTGLDRLGGHRIVEIGAVELVDRPHVSPLTATRCSEVRRMVWGEVNLEDATWTFRKSG